MTEVFEPTGPHDQRLALRSVGLLARFNEAGVLTAADVHVAARAGVLGGEEDEAVLLAVALTVRAVRRGSVALDLPAVGGGDDGLPWPEPTAWLAAVRSSPLVAQGAVRVEHELVYLDRYHRLEVQVADDLHARAALPPPQVDEDRLAAALALVDDDRLNDEQKAAAEHAVRSRTTILVGGPGTGKTTTVGRILLLLRDQALGRGERLSIALAAPTGKAATRLEEAVTEALAEVAGHSDEAGALVAAMPDLAGTTLHRMLGWRGDNSTRFRHHRDNRTGHDVVVVDESSMLDLTMVARLLEAVRPESRLLLVGDPEQLTSVGAGAVLGDLVEGYAGHPGSPVVALRQNHRFTGAIGRVAAALRAGDADTVLATLDAGGAPGDEVGLVEAATEAEVEAAIRDSCVSAARVVRDEARAGRVDEALVALDDHRLLCAHREGPWGAGTWNRRVERWLAEDDERRGVPPAYGPWYAGRPLLVTSNDYTLALYNGETGVVAPVGDRLRACFPGGRQVSPGRLDAVETVHAMTVHKSQGSQAREVTVLLPDGASALLTRELFYTALTRARERVRVVGTREAVRAAVDTRADRATGLADRLRGHLGGGRRGRLHGGVRGRADRPGSPDARH